MTSGNYSADTTANIEFATNFQEHWGDSGNNLVENAVRDIFVEMSLIAKRLQKLL